MGQGAERCGHGLGLVETLSARSMYKIDRRGGGQGAWGVQKSLFSKLPLPFYPQTFSSLLTFLFFYFIFPTSYPLGERGRSKKSYLQALSSLNLYSVFNPGMDGIVNVLQDVLRGSNSSDKDLGEDVFDHDEFFHQQVGFILIDSRLLKLQITKTTVRLNDVKQSNEHNPEQLCNAHRPISPNKMIFKLLGRYQIHIILLFGYFSI